ncbi:MAG: hypothetical protein RIC04_13285 [Parvibaculum sp.]
MTAELALLFGKALEQSPEYWMNLQAAHDLKTAEKEMRRHLKSVPTIAAE